jgi:hypothetical protein
MLINKRSESIQSLANYIDLGTNTFNKLAQEAVTTAEECEFYLHNALEVLTHYYEVELPIVEPLAMQVKNEFEADEFRVYQIYDLITNDDVIVDYKAPMKRFGKTKGEWAPKTFDHVIQLYCYYHGFFADHGYYPTGLELHYLMPTKIMKTKTHPVEIVKVKLDYEQIKDEAEVQISRAWGKIQAVHNGNYYPNRNRLNFLCSRKWCDYWEECEKQFGGKIRP